MRRGRTQTRIRVSTAIVAYAAAVNGQIAERFSELTSGTHSIVVKVLGTKNAAANSANVIIDAFVLYSP
jgi:hypothetical protein